MSTNAYIILDGVTGPSQVVKGAIEIFSFSWGAHSPVSIASSSGQRSAGKANVSDVTIMKSLDSTSKDIVSHIFKHQTYPKVELVYMKQLNGDNQKYFYLNMKNVYITSYSISGSSENPTESVSLSFEEIEFNYKPEKPDGKSLDGALKATYNAVTNVGS